MTRPRPALPRLGRVLAVDPGSRRLKFVLARSWLGRVRIQREESLDLREEGLVGADELALQLQMLLERCDHPPLALALPPPLTVSQCLDLPPSPAGEVRLLIEAETRKLSGVSESPILYDFIPLAATHPDRDRFWVTFGKERDIHESIRQLGLEQEDLCEVTTTANALVAAYHAAAPRSQDALLVHVGTRQTLVVGMAKGEAEFAASFAPGGDALLGALASARGCSLQELEDLSTVRPPPGGNPVPPQVAGLLEAWVRELSRHMADWFKARRGTGQQREAVEVVVGGAVFERLGLDDALKNHTELNFRSWPRGTQLPAPGFEIAYGTALMALGHAAQPVSLLPQGHRALWSQRRTTRTLELANAFLLFVCLVAILAASAHKLSVIRQKEAMLARVERSLGMLQEQRAISTNVARQYEFLRPVLQRQQTTTDLLATLEALHAARGNTALWLVLLADQQTYFALPSATGTNRIEASNLLAALSARRLAAEQPLDTLTGPVLPSPAKPGLIAELSVPEDLDTTRRVLSQVVNELKERPLFERVDLLPDDLRRAAADPKVILAQRHFALALDWAATEFHQTAAPQRPAPATGSRFFRRSPPNGEDGQVARPGGTPP